MNKAVPWRIKGVGFDVRAAANEAAHRAGLSLGEWLNTIIAKQAERDGVDEAELDADDRIDAVKQHLSALRDGGDPFGEHASELPVPPQAARPAERERDRERGALEGERRQPHNPPMPRETFREQIDAERLLENAIAAFDRRANRSSERTARALAEVAELIDAGHRNRDRDDKALSSIADRLSHIERRVAREPAPQADTSVQDALARLERRIEKLAQRAAAPPPAPPTPPAPQPAPAGRRPLAAAIAEVARRQQELEGQYGAGPAPDPYAAPPAPVVRPPAAVPSALEARLSRSWTGSRRTPLRRRASRTPRRTFRACAAISTL